MERFGITITIFLGAFMLAASIFSYVKLKTPWFAAYALLISALSFISAYLFTKGRRQGVTAFYLTLALHFAGIALFEWYA
jgi:hypothetical protein